MILQADRLLLVNAYPGGRSDLWCAPGGGVERGSSLPDNLIREVHEETGLDIAVGIPCLVNEFHDPKGSFHQVDLYFHAEIVGGRLDHAWRDPEGIVTERRFVSRAEMAEMRVKPDSLADVAWARDRVSQQRIFYDPLEPIQR